MAKILGSGGRLDSVEAGASVTEVTSAGRFNTTYCDAALLATTSGAAQTAKLPLTDAAGAALTLASGETGWFHFDYYFNSNTFTSAGNISQLEDTSGFPWLAIRKTSATGHGLYYNSGTGAAPVWTIVPGTVAIGVAEALLASHDIKVTIGSGGTHTAEWYIGNGLQASGSFTQALFTNVRKVAFAGATESGSTFAFSQLLATEGISTINAKVKYSRPTGAGSNSGWTSAAATNVNEAINLDTTFDQSATAAQKQSYAMGDVTVPAGMRIVSVEHCMRVKNDGAAPANIKSIIRSGGTDFLSAANLTGVSTGFTAARRRLTTDPATGVDWTQTGWNAAEAGYESET